MEALQKRKVWNDFALLKVGPLLSYLSILYTYLLSYVLASLFFLLFKLNSEKSKNREGKDFCEEATLKKRGFA